MAYTKVFAIRKRLDHTIAYAANPEKTVLSEMIEYAENPEKRPLVTAINCTKENAAEEMQLTKRRWQKTDGILGYHVIQSFSPGEVRADKAHEIGVRFAEALFGDRFEAVIATHLDQKHLHNHIVINSVSFLDGRKYHSNSGNYYGKIRVLSDSLCREHQLSTITPKGYGKHYAAYQAERQNKLTIRSMIRSDIDAVIDEAYSLQSFFTLLKQRGYEVHDNPNRKYITVKPPGGRRAIRLVSLGDGYGEDDLKKRIAENRFGIVKEPPKKKRYRSKYPLPKKRRKLKGFQALYFRYVYFLKGSRTRRHKQYLSYEMKKEVLRLEKYERGLRYLLEHDIATEDELKNVIAQLEEEAIGLKAERNRLYPMRRQTDNIDKIQTYTETIAEYTLRLKENRKAYRLLKEVEKTVPKIIAQIQKPEEKLREEVREYEYKWRDR